MPVGEGGSLLTAKLDSNPQCSEEVGETLESSSGNNPIILDFGVSGPWVLVLHGVFPRVVLIINDGFHLPRSWLLSNLAVHVNFN